jgi:hypothetical protein
MKVRLPDALSRSAMAGVFLLVAASASGQGAAQSPYRANAADEDWTFLKTAERTDFWDPVKYIPLGPEDWSLTLSSELRFRFEGFRVHDAQGPRPAVDNYLLQRYLIGTDWRLGPRVRVFTELQSGILTGKLQSPRPTDRNPLDMHQAFVQFVQPVREKDRVGIIVGRQEIEIGSSRLISASPGLNVKRSFDGVAAAYRAPSWAVVAVGAKLVDLNDGLFDDRPDPDRLFWGLAVTRPGPSLERSDVGIYYLGIDSEQSLFAQGQAPERRHTIGVKWSGSGSRIDLNYDALFQWGSFGDAPIRAWGFASETGYRFPDVPWTPRISARTDWASGDRDASDPSLQSFNPLFPGNAYSGAVGLLGPTNLTDFNLGFTLTPRRGLTLGVEAPSYWRTSESDGVYGTDLRVIFPPGIGTGKYVGTNPGVLVVWQATRHLQLQGVVTRFISSDFLENTFVAGGFGFYSFTVRYRF